MKVRELVARHCYKVTVAHKWNRLAASKALGLSENTLRRHLRAAEALGLGWVPGDEEIAAVDAVKVLQDAQVIS